MTITFSVLAGIAGTWSGVGHAEFPTISPLDYREELVLSSNDKDPVIHFEQRTWVKSGDAKKTVNRSSGNQASSLKGETASSNSSLPRRGGRMEILKGGAEHGEKGSIVLHLKSTTILNDPRMIQSERRIVWSGETLTYELLMSTTANTKTARHLAARLLRNSK